MHLYSGQITFFLLYFTTIVLYVVSEYHSRLRSKNGCSINEDNDSATNKLASAPKSSKPVASVAVSVAETEWRSFLSLLYNNAMMRCLRFDPSELVNQRDTLRAMAEFGTLIFWYFLVDRVHIFSTKAKHYNRDLFFFIFTWLVVAGLLSSIRTLPTATLLNRSQTEEWKGWMQVLFVLYHYFKAEEIYNVIRLCVASYVWMTGYGNFMYYYRNSTFCLNRFLQTMWRLNFLVFFACLAMGNHYMLYYICPMHTLFTLLVVACLVVAPGLNRTSAGIWAKILTCFLFIFVIWEHVEVFNFVWAPFGWLLKFNGENPSKPTLQPWFYRSGLDRYVWIHGMICAYFQPSAVAALQYIDERPLVSRTAIRTALLTVCGVLSYVYYVYVLSRPREQYLKLHPFTSWIPISLWIVFRNLTPGLRARHVRLLGWLGCITLETYISQFHTWMMTSRPDSKPAVNVRILPQQYRLLNFSLTTAIFVGVSLRLFHLTVKLKDVAVPGGADSRLLCRNLILMMVSGAVFYTCAYGIRTGIPGATAGFVTAPTAAVNSIAAPPVDSSLPRPVLRAFFF